MSDIDIAKARVAELKRLTDRIAKLEQALRPFAEKGWAAVCVAHEDRVKPLPRDTMLSVCATIAEVDAARDTLRGQGAGEERKR